MADTQTIRTPVFDLCTPCRRLNDTVKVYRTRNALALSRPASDQCLPAAQAAECSVRVSCMFEGPARTRAPCPPAARAAGTGPPQSAARPRPPRRHGQHQHRLRQPPLLWACLVCSACARAAFGLSGAMTFLRRESHISAAHAPAAPGLAGAMRERWHAIRHRWRDELQLGGGGCSTGHGQHGRTACSPRILHRAVLHSTERSQAAGNVRRVGRYTVA